jgi:LuxR family maltose regulon positive regulatory protein
MARVREAEGDLDGAATLLAEAERVYAGDFSPDVRPIAAMRARVLIAQGSWVDALSWARDRGLSADDDLSYLREFEHVTLARALLARSRSERAGPPLESAVGLLQRLLRRPRPAAGRGAPSRSWCCRQSRSRYGATSLQRWSRWDRH